MATEQMKIKAIGFVRSDVTERPRRGFDWGRIVSEIVVEPHLTEGLDGISGFSHIIVIAWMHQATAAGDMALKVHPRGRKELARVGVFASRSPYRPNPLGKTTAKLLERQGNVLKVTGLDMINGTPVVDIKPYIPGSDSADGATAPQWVKKR